MFHLPRHLPPPSAGDLGRAAPHLAILARENALPAERRHHLDRAALAVVTKIARGTSRQQRGLKLRKYKGAVQNPLA